MYYVCVDSVTVVVSGGCGGCGSDGDGADKGKTKISGVGDCVTLNKRGTRTAINFKTTLITPMRNI